MLKFREPLVPHAARPRGGSSSWVTCPEGTAVAESPVCTVSPQPQTPWEPVVKGRGGPTAPGGGSWVRSYQGRRTCRARVQSAGDGGERGNHAEPSPPQVSAPELGGRSGTQHVTRASAEAQKMRRQGLGMPWAGAGLRNKAWGLARTPQGPQARAPKTAARSASTSTVGLTGSN